MTHILIINARFYESISDSLERGAESALLAAGATFDTISVPGALEIPAAIRFALMSQKYDGYVALGCVIRGETYHFEIVCNESARGLTELSLNGDLAIGNGILTVENEAQAWARADINHGNKGAGAANACLRLIELKKQFRS